MRAFWLLAILALALGTLAPRIAVAADGSALVGVFPGPLVSAVTLCLLAHAGLVAMRSAANRQETEEKGAAIPA